MRIFQPPNSGWQARWKLPCSRVRRRHSVSNNLISATSNGRSARNNTISLRLQRRKKPRNLRQRSPIKDTKMTIFDNYEVWFVIGSQHLYGPEALRQVTKHAEHVVNSLNAEAKLPCKLVLKPLGTTRTRSPISAATPTTMTNAPGLWSGCIPSRRQKCGSMA